MKEFIVPANEFEEEIARTAGYKEFIRCKKCRYFQEGIDINGEPFTRCNCGKKQPMTWGASVAPDWFCGHAEAKDGEQK